MYSTRYPSCSENLSKTTGKEDAIWQMLFCNLSELTSFIHDQGLSNCDVTLLSECHQDEYISLQISLEFNLHLSPALIFLMRFQKTRQLDKSI